MTYSFMEGWILITLTLKSIYYYNIYYTTNYVYILNTNVYKLELYGIKFFFNLFVLHFRSWNMRLLCKHTVLLFLGGKSLCSLRLWYLIRLKWLMLHTLIEMFYFLKTLFRSLGSWNGANCVIYIFEKLEIYYR